MNTYHAHGKLLLSAEYMVMYGARALALPLVPGQSLECFRSDSPDSFSWSAFHQDNQWFSARFDPGSLKILETSNRVVAKRLQEVIRACIVLMPTFQEELFHNDVVTRIDFPPEYGFGSSSTLIALLADWAEVNPLDLHFMVSNGSGYDVACALAEGPIIYHMMDQSPHYRHITFRPPFSNQLYFAWLGNKQPTASHLEKVSAKLDPDHETIQYFSQMTMKMVESGTLDEFRIAMAEHEEKLSSILGMEPVSARFEGLPGSVKSLGAWGGDFVMIASWLEEDSLRDYLKSQGIDVVYRYKEIVYDKSGQ